MSAVRCLSVFLGGDCAPPSNPRRQLSPHRLSLEELVVDRIGQRLPRGVDHVVAHADRAPRRAAVAAFHKDARAGVRAGAAV